MARQIAAQTFDGSVQDIPQTFALSRRQRDLNRFVGVFEIIQENNIRRRAARPCPWKEKIFNQMCSAQSRFASNKDIKFHPRDGEAHFQSLARTALEKAGRICCFTDVGTAQNLARVGFVSEAADLERGVVFHVCFMKRQIEGLSAGFGKRIVGLCWPCKLSGYY